MKFLLKISKRYLISEICSYLSAIVCTSITAAVSDRYTKSDILISLISTICGSIGFFAGGLTSFAILHIAQYRTGRRHFRADMKAMFISNLHGIWATYLFRIPFQYMLQKLNVAPVIAAPIAQTVAGQVGTVVRVYSNYKKKIFGHK